MHHRNKMYKEMTDYLDDQIEKLTKQNETKNYNNMEIQLKSNC